MTRRLPLFVVDCHNLADVLDLHIYHLVYAHVLHVLTLHYTLGLISCDFEAGIL